ncbi:MAG: hypothetical protein C0602_12960 [Denitrovibrio sp.]|nr:MAG: hypothetical protein C0602_12960 [Denitrovibrio sp.]
MRTHVLDHTTAVNSERLKLRTLMFASIALVLLFSVVYVRHLCIKTGYEISNLTDNMEKVEISYLSLLDKKSKAYDTENLYKKAREIGLVMPDVKRTFYVK